MEKKEDVHFATFNVTNVIRSLSRKDSLKRHHRTIHEKLKEQGVFTQNARKSSFIKLEC